MYMYQHWCYNVFTPQTPNSDKLLIFLHNTTSESHIKVTRIKEMITNKGNSWLFNRFSLSAPYKMYEKGMKNIHIDEEVYRVKQWPKHRALSSPFFFFFFLNLPFTTKLLGKIFLQYSTIAEHVTGFWSYRFWLALVVKLVACNIKLHRHFFVSYCWPKWVKFRALK